MVPASLKRSLRTQPASVVAKKVGKQFTLNTGHVSFFYDKMAYLRNRMLRIAKEMENRGWTVDYDRLSAFDGIEPRWFNDWQETEDARKIVQERIALRISQKPHLYKV